MKPLNEHKNQTFKIKLGDGSFVCALYLHPDGWQNLRNHVFKREDNGQILRVNEENILQLTKQKEKP